MDYSAAYDPEADFDRWYTRAAAEVIRSLVRPGDSILELGCATGAMTADFVARGATVLGVERSERYLERASARGLATARFVHADLDVWRPEETGQYDHCVMTNVLHEVSQPDRLLATARSSVRHTGLAHLTLQNPMSVHRQVGHAAGLIDDLFEVSARGHSYGTRALWSADQLQAMAEKAGFRCVLRRGLMLKPFSNAQMEALPETTLEALLAAGLRFPDSCAMNYLLLAPA
jgi:2-polyprenyl-3-methyl-5-hydroxy-6-metoxy-1,4-benzoquinol methylase